MTELLDRAISQLRDLSPSDQDEAARALMSFVENRYSDLRLTPDQVEEVRKTMEGLRDGSVGIAADEEVEEMWRRLGA